MDLLPITLGIARQVSKPGDAKNKKHSAGLKPGADAVSGIQKIPLEIKNKILERDSYTCRFCGFHAKKYQEIHVRNYDYSDFSDENLATACIFCHQCFHLENVSAMGSGMLIWLPEIDQAELHHIARAIYVARISQGPIADAARKALESLKIRNTEAITRISTNNPYILATVLRDYLGAKHYKMREQKLAGIRLFPLERRIIKEADLEFNQFPQILAYWRSKDGPFGGKPPTEWMSIYLDATKAA